MPRKYIDACAYDRLLTRLDDWRIDYFCDDPLVPFILPPENRGLLHLTSPEALLEIMRDGFLRPNIGQFPHSCEKSARGFARSMGYIALFDFETTNVEDVVVAWDTTRFFFYLFNPLTLGLWIERECLIQSLIPNSAAPGISSPRYELNVPYVEVWYGSPIPITAFKLGLAIIRPIGKEPPYIEAVEIAELYEFSKEFVAKRQESSLNSI